MQRRLLKWFRLFGRDLPWRKTSDPYAIVVSEIMLQQTQVDRVIPKYHAFLKQFPHWRALSVAPQSEVIKSWSGLGYNRRALGLHKLARGVVGVDVSLPVRSISAQAGVDPPQFPDDYASLVKLPGIGPYTAQAVRAFAFKKADAAPVDTNIERVVKRVFGAYELDRRNIEHLALSLLPRDTWSWNHALMDFGATICTARTPKCEECPLKDICAAYPCEGNDIKKNKQPKFEDSDRFYRGKVISLLTEPQILRQGLRTPQGGVLRRNNLLKFVGLLDDARAERILAGLIKDGFIKVRRDRISLV